MNLVELNSVGSLIDLEEKIVYPQMVNGLPDLDCGVELVEVDDEWAFCLDERDREILIDNNLLEIFQIMKDVPYIQMYRNGNWKWIIPIQIAVFLFFILMFNLEM